MIDFSGYDFVVARLLNAAKHSLDPRHDVTDGESHDDAKRKEDHEHEDSPITFVPTELRVVIAVGGLGTPINIKQHAFREPLFSENLSRLLVAALLTLIDTLS